MPLIEWVNFEDTRIAVVGDLMLDLYLHGTVTRTSPEASVIVFKRHEENGVDNRLGGACNAAANILSLGGHASLHGVVGNDEDASTLRALASGIELQYMPVSDQRPTTKKIRLIDQFGRQTGARIDVESCRPLSNDLVHRIVEDVRSLSPHAILVSDYGKGVVTKYLLESLADLHLPIIVDPKNCFSHYEGASILTPNEREFREYSESIAPEDILKKYGLDAIFVTKGENGVDVYTVGKITNIPAHNVEVYDVTGAGDSFIAACTLARATGLDYLDCAKIGNYAGGLAVKRKGTHAVTGDELREALSHDRT